MTCNFLTRSGSESDVKKNHRSSVDMGNCCFGDEDKVEDNEPDERTRLLPETRPIYSAPDEINAEQTEPSENDEQAVLSRIVQEAQESLIDVSAFDQHALEHHEYVDRSRMYATRINNEFERQIRDAIQKTARTRGVAPAAAANSTAQRLADFQAETQSDEAELMQQLTADFRQRLASCGIRSAGDLVVRVTGERNGQPMFIGQVPSVQNGGPYMPGAVPPTGLLPNAAMMSTVAHA